MFSKIQNWKQKLFSNHPVKCNHHPAGTTFHPTCDANENNLSIHRGGTLQVWQMVSQLGNTRREEGVEEGPPTHLATKIITFPILIPSLFHTVFLTTNLKSWHTSLPQESLPYQSLPQPSLPQQSLAQTRLSCGHEEPVLAGATDSSICPRLPWTALD